MPSVCVYSARHWVMVSSRFFRQKLDTDKEAPRRWGLPVFLYFFLLVTADHLMDKTLPAGWPF